jgi:AcrR family transcriptional regulator
MVKASPRERLLQAAAELITRDGELSTRAVCEAAGVAAPTLYHHFGDKDGLVEAAVAHAYESNLARKRARRRSGDPVDDVRRGWDEHVAFAAEHPGFYRLMYARADSSAEPPAPAREAREIVMEEIRRIAEAGQLRVEPELAADVIGAAVRGVGAMHASRQETPLAAAVSELVREAVLGALFADATGADGPAPDGAAAAHALALAEHVREGTAELSGAEAELLREWLRRLAAAERREKQGKEKGR